MCVSIRATYSVQMWRIDSSSLVRGASWQCHCTLKCWKEVCQARTKSKPSHYNCTHIVSCSPATLPPVPFLSCFGNQTWGPPFGSSALYSMSMKLVFCIQYIRWNCIIVLQYRFFTLYKGPPLIGMWSCDLIASWATITVVAESPVVLLARRPIYSARNFPHFIASHLDE